MIHAGVIRIGSAYTAGVCGAYCSNSMSRLRNTTLPGVTATSLPTSNCSVPAARPPRTARCASSSQFLQSADEILAGFRGGLVEQLGIGLQEIRRRGGFEQQPPGETQARLLGVGRRCRRLQGLLPPGSPVGVGACVALKGQTFQAVSLNPSSSCPGASGAPPAARAMNCQLSRIFS